MLMSQVLLLLLLLLLLHLMFMVVVVVVAVVMVVMVFLLRVRLTAVGQLWQQVVTLPRPNVAPAVVRCVCGWCICSGRCACAAGGPCATSTCTAAARHRCDWGHA